MKKKYYAVDTEIDSGKLGTVPQILTLTANDDFSKDEFIESLNAGTTEYYDSYCFELAQGAMLTDVLSNSKISSTKGLFLSDKVKDTLSKFEIPFAKFYPIKIKSDDVFLTKYYFLHLLPPPHECFDFLASSFQKWTFTDGVVGDIEINSYEEFKQKATELLKKTIFTTYKEVYFTSQFNKRTAMFRLNPDSANIYVSEELKDKLIEYRITGLDFKESSIIFHA